MHGHVCTDTHTAQDGPIWREMDRVTSARRRGRGKTKRDHKEIAKKRAPENVKRDGQEEKREGERQRKEETQRTRRRGKSRERERERKKEREREKEKEKERERERENGKEIER